MPLRLPDILPLTQVSRQLRAETKALPYALNSFIVGLPDLKDFVDSFPVEVRGYLQTLVLVARFYWDEEWENFEGPEFETLPLLTGLKKVVVDCETGTTEEWEHMFARHLGSMGLVVERAERRTAPASSRPYMLRWGEL